MSNLLASVASALLIGSSLADVVTIPHPDLELAPAKTAVWSPVFQATWDAIKEKSGGPPARIDPPNELMAKLDAFRFDAKSVMPENLWKTWVGPATQDFLEQVNKEAVMITKEEAGPFHLTGGPPGSLAAFGLLNRQIEYNRALYRSQKKPIAFTAPAGQAAVQFFGVAGELSSEFHDVVRVLSYDPKAKSHAVEVLCEQGHESVIFYLPPVAQNFTTACTAVKDWKENYKNRVKKWGTIDNPILHRNDSLRVPYVTLNVTSTFPELFKSLRYPEKGGVPWRIYQAEQVTRFDLHEKGARVRITSRFETEPFGDPPPRLPTVPRDFSYDRPFFIFLWREKAEWPYFGAWIGDATALQPFK